MSWEVAGNGNSHWLRDVVEWRGFPWELLWQLQWRCVGVDVECPSGLRDSVGYRRGIPWCAAEPRERPQDSMTGSDQEIMIPGFNHARCNGGQTRQREWSLDAFPS